MMHLQAPRSLLLLNLFLIQLASAAGIRSLYLFKDVMKSNTTAITTSGFNTLIIFGVGILANGDIEYYSNTPGSSDVLVASNGSYVGGDALAAKVRSFKTSSNTGVQRVEISMNSQNVASLMSQPGPGANTRLYRNFAALKTAWALDAVNNDDESIYDVSSTVAFAKMLGRLGYKYTGVPYTETEFWVALKTQLDTNTKNSNTSPLLDRIYLQFYDGGAGNDPSSWASSLGMDVVPLLWVINDSKPSQGTTAAQAKVEFAAWKQSGGVAGGGFWNDYDIEKMGSSYGDYGRVLTSVFP